MSDRNPAYDYDTPVGVQMTTDLVNDWQDLTHLPVGAVMLTATDSTWRKMPAGDFAEVGEPGTFEAEDVEGEDEYFPAKVIYIPTY